MQKIYFLLASILLTVTSIAQPTQNVRGKVFDSETFSPITAAKVQIPTKDSTNLYRAITDDDGSFLISNVPVGKYSLIVTFFGYDDKTVHIEVNSGKETILDIPMTEAYYTNAEEVVVTARKSGEVINELALISARQFSVEETNRYAGSRSDPARMASNFAGVQGADDSRNDIVVRGNSPLGVVWKVEGIDIPNPSHFATSGSTGGPVTILNNKLLGNSDFFMSAFPAEYGNSTAAVFDLKLRNGNNSNHEFTGQFGFLGTELLAEGPMSKTGNSSYLIMGRYSTLSIFKAMGIKIGTDAVPEYGDGAFKFNWRFKNGGNLSFFGIGGKSNIQIMISEQTKVSTEMYGEGDRDQYFGTSMLVSGFNYKQSLSDKTFLTTTLAYSYDEQHSHHNYLLRHVDTLLKGTPDEFQNITIDSAYQLMGYQFQFHKVAYHIAVTHKFNTRHLIKAGINTDLYYTIQRDSALALVTDKNFQLRWDYSGAYTLIQPFIQWKWRATENMDVTAGLHAQYFSLSNRFSGIEPRIGWRWKIKNNHSIFAGAGMHSQTQPLYTYTYNKFDANGDKIYHNKNMDFSKSIHTGIGYESFLGKSWNLKFETYYQYLYSIPVTIQPSSFSLINMGAGFQRFFPDSLSNKGTGRNYGLEVTVQKFFDKSFFVLVTASLYDSQYKGSDGVMRNTSYNGNYVFNVLGGKEFKLGVKQSISLGIKATYAGGQRYGYVDLVETEKYHELVFVDEGFNSRRFKNYFRLDLKLSWKYNARKLTHEIGLDLVNILNTKNVLSLAYAPNLVDPTAEPIATKNQLGFLPLFYYKIDFRFTKKTN
ncbi:MAG: TonB-dependent receptor [Crocinitomicaceae bacterium]|nr:TonB-dependent receptor [Crocinitomicaceae bacterium]